MQRPLALGILPVLAFALACRPGAADRLAPGEPERARGTEADDALPEPTLDDGAAWVRERYVKEEVRIPMRDGVTLLTSIYRPRDTGREVPIMLLRTPYGVGPYGDDAYRDVLAPSRTLQERGWIFVFQDVRGRFMSEGQFVNMRPHRSGDEDGAIDESTDAYDTIEWLLQHVERHNGRVGMWGI